MTGSEKWYVLRVENPKEIIKSLIEDGVPCNSVESSNPNMECITFPASSKNKVFSKIGKSQSEEYSVVPTDSKNIFFISFIAETVDENTPPPGEHFEAWKDMIPVIQGVQNVFNIKIVSSNPHGNPRGPSDSTKENILYVYFWSTPEPSEATKLKTVFGIPLKDGQFDAFKPSNRWHVIKDDAGTEVAEYVNNNLYILFDLPHSSGEGVTEMFTRIMKAYFAIKGKSEGQLANFYHSIRGESGASSKSAFVRSCSKLHEKKLKSMEESLKKHESEISKLDEQIVSVIREKEMLETALLPLKKSIEERRKIAENEYDILMATPHVKDVIAVGDVIHIFTDTISIPKNGSVYNIGDFRIDINTSARNSTIKAFNLTRMKNIGGTHVHHPHIKDDGYCCLGNVSQSVNKLLASYQYVILGQVMINFLLSYNKESAYLYVEEWR